MSEVTCPRCHTRQSIGAHAPGYVCAECEAEWSFATCDRCGQRFHMQPGTTSWTCPNCGAQHGAPAVAQATSGPPSGRRARRGQANVMPLLAVAGIVLVVIVAVVLTRGGGGGASSPTPTPDPVAALCLHLRDLQTPRVDAFTRVAQEISDDAAAIAATGNQQLADDVRQLRKAVIVYRDVLATQGDDTQAIEDMAAASRKVPC